MQLMWGIRSFQRYPICQAELCGNVFHCVLKKQLTTKRKDCTGFFKDLSIAQHSC